MCLKTIETIAHFNGKFLNNSRVQWEGTDLTDIFIGLDLPFFIEMWPAMSAGIATMGPDAFDAGDILGKTDPFWDSVNHFVENQVDYYLSMTAQEAGGLYNCTVSHGDIRSENVFFPKDRMSTPCFIDFQLGRQHLAAYDCVYFYTTSVPEEFQRKHELQMLNLYYDILINESGSNPDEYTWCDNYPEPRTDTISVILTRHSVGWPGMSSA
jgi:hypothetical protein